MAQDQEKHAWQCRALRFLTDPEIKGDQKASSASHGRMSTRQTRDGEMEREVGRGWAAQARLSGAKASRLRRLGDKRRLLMALGVPGVAAAKGMLHAQPGKAIT